MGWYGLVVHIHLSNLLVHDIGGAEMKHKESGLVVISPGSVDQRFDDVLVDGVSAYNTQEWVGIMVGGGNFGYAIRQTWRRWFVGRNDSQTTVSESCDKDKQIASLTCETAFLSQLIHQAVNRIS